MQSSSSILDRLVRLRATVRRRLLWIGLCAVAAGGVLSFLTVVVLDWFLDFPAALRIVVAGMFLTGFALAALHWIVRPLRARIRVEDIAFRMERMFPELGDRLSSTVNFLQAPLSGSASLTREFLTDAEQRIAAAPLESSLRRRPLAIGILMVFLGGVLLFGLAAASPKWVSTGVARYLQPFGEAEWPRVVEIVPLTGDLTAAMGDSVTLMMRISRGPVSSLRALVHVKDVSGSVISLAMQREDENLFRATVDSVASDLTYWFEAGDDDTASRSKTINVVRRPEVVEAIAHVSPPDYSDRKNTLVYLLDEDSTRAPIGGVLEIRVRSNKELASDDARMGLEFESGGFAPLIRDAENPREATTRFAVTENDSFRIELRDEEGFANRGAGRHGIEALPDAPPTVAFVRPRSDVEATPRGGVEVAVRAEDDFGLRRLVLAVERGSSGPTSQIELTDSMAISIQADRVEAAASRTINLTSLSASPGDLVTLTATAVDSFPGEGGRRTVSAATRIRIISDAEFEVRIREELAQMEERIRQAALEQVELSVRTLATAQDASAASDFRRESIVANSLQQARLTRKVSDLSRRLFELGAQFARNRPDDPSEARSVASLAEALSKTAMGTMTTAGNSLVRATDHGGGEGVVDILREASALQQEAAQQLRALLKTMAQWGAFQGLLARTRDVLDRQSTLHEQTAAIGKSMIGKSSQELSPAESAALARKHHQQEQLNADIQQLLERMEQLQTTQARRDPAGVEAVESAVRAANAHEIPKRLSAAADALKNNRTSAAATEQKAIQKGLHAVVNALRQREDRELENLRKELGRGEEQIALLIREQQALQTRVDDADGAAAQASAEEWEQEQRRIARNTSALAQEFTDDEKMAPVGRTLDQASDPMEAALLSLQKTAWGSAVEKQSAALEFLREALRMLEALSVEAEREDLARTLSQIRDELEAIHSAQSEVHVGVATLAADVTESGKIGRAQAREAGRLARMQLEIRSSVDSILADVAKVPVYDWALQRTVRWMDEIRSSLEQRVIGAALESTSDRVLRELRMLIQATIDTQELPYDSKFVENDRDGGGGSGGEPTSGGSLPPVTELLLLRSMQSEINERTRKSAETVNPSIADEAQLRKIAVLAEDQLELKRLTEKVIERSSQP